MAVDIFLELKDIKGEAQDEDFAKKSAIDVLAFSWSVSQTGNAHMGPGAGAGKANAGDLSITKYIDNASTTLMAFCANGKHIATGKLSFRKAGEKPMVYLEIELKDIIISSYSTGGGGGEDRFTEHVSLNFAEIKYTYWLQKVDGSQGASIPKTWNIAKNMLT